MRHIQFVHTNTCSNKFMHIYQHKTTNAKNKKPLTL